MGIFSRNQGENRNNITSVVLIEQTQKYKNKTSWGLSFSNSVFIDGNLVVEISRSPKLKIDL